MMLKRLILPILTLLFSFTLVAYSDEWERARHQMVETEIVASGVENTRVIEAMRETPRHEFVPRKQRKLSYFDMALPIGSDQTISPPFVVAYMTEKLNPKPSDKVLEIGTGSGYQAAVLSSLVRSVYTIEIVPELGRRAQKTLKRLSFDNVNTRIGDGYLGWSEAAPFDKIIVTCSPENPPRALVDQLKEGGIMVIPVGERYQQNLYQLKKVNGKLEKQILEATLFVPMTGKAEERREVKPDPLHPEIENGDFENHITGDSKDPLPKGWHYLRQAKIHKRINADPASFSLKFSNKESGKPSQALQGFAVDGRKIDRLKIGFEIRGESIRYGLKPTEWPYFVVTFYDERRAVLASETIGPFRGTFPWTEYLEAMPVPFKAREAIVRIGLLGATGNLEMDNITLSAN